MQRQLTYLGLLGYVFIGTAAVLVPSIMPLITEDYSIAGLTLTTIGLLFPARAIGGILGNLLSGVASDLLGRQRLVWLSALLLAASFGLSTLAQPWLFFLVAFALVSAAQGALSTGINAMIADANQEARSRALNLLHGIYGVGAAISPLIIGYILGQGVAWRWTLAGTGLIWLLYGGLVYWLYGNGGKREGQGEEVKGHGSEGTGDENKTQSKALTLSMLWQAPFLAVALIAFIYNGVAYSLLNWVALFMQESAGFSIFASVSVISVFYAALTLGRFACTAFSESLGYARTLLLLAVVVTVTYPLVVMKGNSAVMILGVFCTGLGLSGLFPTALAYGSRLYPEQTGTLTGTLNVAMTLGAMIPPLWTGFLAEQWGFQTALGINFVMVPPLILIAFYLRQVEKTAEKTV
ncbi:MAG: MFS transporter [Chloroflexota bacterium]